MISKMMKYDIVLHAASYQDFIDKVREIGLVDITTTGWESSDDERELILEIEARQKAVKALEAFEQSDDFVKESAKLKSASEAFDVYTSAKATIAQDKAQIALLEVAMEQTAVWGDFSVESLDSLEAKGVTLRFFMASEGNYKENSEQWNELYTLEHINTLEGKSYFVVVTRPGDEVTLDAQELKRPTATVEQCKAEIETLEKEIKRCNKELSEATISRSLIEDEARSIIELLQNSKVKSTAAKAADGSLLVMEGWAEELTAAKVDSFMNAYDGVIYLKSKPTPEDNTPVKLKNNLFSNAFEIVGNMYALPKYGTIDLTPFFAPFYMLFFAICLCDAGYGMMIALAGLGLYLKGGKSMRQASHLSLICGGAAMAFGFYANSFFGMTISDAPLFGGFKFLNFQKDFFSIAMIIGIIQILFGMVINIVVTSRTFGVKYALGSIGWFSLLVVSIASFMAGSMGITWLGIGSVPFMVLAGVAVVLMLFFNSPDKNIFSNVGSGLWDTYNNVTGLLGDVLSYIRLFAIGLSGGVLALVFNSLAVGMTGLDAGVEGLPVWSIAVKVIFATIILLFGHAINLFMSTISSAVHPMRLTFVEFYRSAGFEMTQRTFEPLESKKH